jgi:ABC-2 type transport system permease protein
MTAFLHHFTFEFRVGMRNRTLLLMNYLLPLGFYAMMGLIIAQVNPAFKETMIPAMVIFAILSGTLLGLPDPLVNARESGVFRSYKINGIPALSILIIPALTTLLHMAVVSIIIVLTGPSFFEAIAPQDWLGFILVFLGVGVAHAGLGVLIGAISANSRVTVLWSQLIYLPSMILGGLMLPINTLPEGMAKIALLIPSSYGMQAFQGLAMGAETLFDPWAALGILFAGGMLAFGLALALFQWDSRNTTRRFHPIIALLALLPYVLGMLVLG